MRVILLIIKVLGPFKYNKIPQVLKLLSNYIFIPPTLINLTKTIGTQVKFSHFFYLWALLLYLVFPEEWQPASVSPLLQLPPLTVIFPKYPLFIISKAPVLHQLQKSPSLLHYHSDVAVSLSCLVSLLVLLLLLLQLLGPKQGFMSVVSSHSL